MRPLLLLLVTALALGAADAPPPLCTVSIDGGIAGLDHLWRVDADGAVSRDDERIGRVDTWRVRALLDRLAAEPPAREPTGGCDLLHYQVVEPRADGERRSEAWDGARPKPLDELLDLLRGGSEAKP